MTIMIDQEHTRFFGLWMELFGWILQGLESYKGILQDGWNALAKAEQNSQI